MSPKLPATLLVMAILNCTFGGLGVLWFGCCWVGLCCTTLGPSQQKDSMAPFQSTYSKVYSEVPGFIPYMMVTEVLGVAMSALLIAAGGDLLRVKSWARVACIIYGVCTIPASIGGLMYQIVVVHPAVNEQNIGRGGEDILYATALPALGGAYAVPLLIVMFLPHVKAAFAKQSTRAEQSRRHAPGRDRPLEPRVESEARCPHCGDPLSRLEVRDGRCDNCRRELPTGLE